MAINETVIGNDSVAVTGIASMGERTVGVKGIGDSVGVRGEGKGWHGVEGISHSSIGGHGVFGANTAGGTGVVGTSTNWVGVYGETAGVEGGPAGVWGEHKGAGIGVKAISNTGVGLVAFSNGIAAVFQGNVDITGNLTIQGVSIQALLQRIVQLERQGANAEQLVQRVSSLENRVNTLSQQVNNIQQQLASLQQKQAEDVQGIAFSLATLAARVTALGG